MISRSLSPVVNQGDDVTATPGLLIQGRVDDAPGSFVAGAAQALSLTSEGRLRVAMVRADIDAVWSATSEEAWNLLNAWAAGPEVW